MKLENEELLRGSVYKSLETDDEFRERIRKSYYVYGLGNMSDAWLDDVVWGALGLQRRIVERQR